MASIMGVGASAETQKQQTQASGSSAGNNTLGYDAFLKLLMAQMQNQDPMEPMNSSDYVAQLATFSQVEKTIELKDRLSDLLSVVKMQQAEGLVGKTITLPDGSVTGIVKSTMVAGSDVIATLQDGTLIRMAPGIVISDTSA